MISDAMQLNVTARPKPIKTTRSRCPVCVAEIPADVMDVGGTIWMKKSCPVHGDFEVKIADDARYYYDSRGVNGSDCCDPATGCCSGPTANETGTTTRALNNDPFDTLSTCVALIEIVDSCNLPCPTCYASSPLGASGDVDCISLENFKQRVAGVLDRKGYIDILQLSGGEPTLHPQFFDLLEWSLAQKTIGYVLINTNAVRLATEDAFLNELAARRTKNSFELYVQFDGPQEAGQKELRGADLRAIRTKAIDAAGALGIPTSLAMVVTPTTIDHLGAALQFGLARPHVRGISFQPMFTTGRAPESLGSLPQLHESPTPISVGDVIRNLATQSNGLLREADFTPLPCGDPNCHTISYILRTPAGPTALGKLIDLQAVQGFLENRLDYRIEDLAQCGCDAEPLGEIIKQFELRPEDPFRIFIKPFMDAWTFDQDRIDRCCTHVIRPDGKLDSFCRYYLNGGAAAHKGGMGVSPVRSRT